jgi:hypothetical protein
MNMDNLDQETLGQNAPVFGQPKRRGWWSRNWLWFVPTVLLALVILCCGCPLAIGLWLYSRVFDLDVFQDAMQKIQANAELTRELGQPISPVRWPPPSFQPEDREMDVRWEIAGPKGRANAHVKARLMKGRWETVILEVVLANGKRVSLAVEEGGNEAPKFEPGKPAAAKPPATKPEAGAPAPQINLPTPPADVPEAK